MIYESLEVGLGERSYPIHIGRSLEEEILTQVETDLATGRRLALITDRNVAEKQAAFLQKAFGHLPVLTLPAGESTKAYRFFETCCNFLAEAGLDRGGRVFAVGGGVIGDLAGFSAASYFRGIGFYQVPTTLLAMVDSSVGGKTGINIPTGKNLVGAFHQPLAVYADLDTLVTLPRREFSAGMAEVIKHGLLADASLFKELEEVGPLEPVSDRLPAIVQRNCLIKASVITADEREEKARGGRALLNLGHTFGHAIEAAAGFGTYLHGEAVGIGLLMACRLSESLQTVEPSVRVRTEALLKAYRLPTALDPAIPVEALLAAARKDKKSRSGKIRYVTLNALGEAATTEGVDEALVRKLWLEFGATP